MVSAPGAPGESRGGDLQADRQADHEGVFGLDSIRLALPVAGPGGRVLAAFLDYLGLGVILFIWLLVCLVLSTFGRSGWLVALLASGVFLLEWGYFAGMEIATGGRTMGKRALRLRVVTAEGARPSPAALLVRNLVRDIDLLVGVPLMFLDPQARRLGDRLGGTLVVHDLVEERPLLLGRVPAGWGAHEVAVVEIFVQQAPLLADAGHRADLAERLLARIARDSPELLEGVRRDDPLQALRTALAVAEG